MVQLVADLAAKLETVPFAGTGTVPEAEFVYLQSGGDSGRVPRFFDRLTAAERQTISSCGTPLSLKRGELLFRQGSPHGGIYIIRKGRIRTFFVAQSGREITLAYWSASHFVGGPEVFGGGAHVIDLGARKSVGWTSSQEWLAAVLNGEDVDAFCNGASAVNG